MSWTRVTSASVTPSSSSAAFTVTVWDVSHVEVVKVSTLLVSAALDRVRSVLAWPLTVTFTSPAGWDWSAPPCS